MNLRKRLRTLVGGILIALLLGGSLTLTLTDALGLTPDYWSLAATCVGTALICAVMSLGLWPFIFSAITLTAAGFAAFYFKWPIYEELRALTLDILSGGALGPHAALICCVIGALITLTGFLLTRMRGGVYPALMLLMLTAMGCWLFSHRLNIYYISPSLVAVAMLFASATREETSFNAAFPIAVVSVAVAMLLIPYMGGISSALQQFSRTVRSTIVDYVMFSDSRTLYSIQADGYQGQSGQLGGNANPSDFPIMRVETDTDLLLRGTIKREYTGRIWVDSSVNSRNLFISPLRRSLRNQVFGLELPVEGEEPPATLMRDVGAQVEFLSRGTSTIFTPNRLTHLTTGADMVTYFNSSGEVFITRTVRTGDTYAFVAQLPDTYAPEMNTYLSGLSRASSYYVSENYMQLPSTLSTAVYDLTYSVISGHTTPYERARAIEDYLEQNYRYTLTPGATPDDADFVSYFLLENKEGYCSYFASAMGVMARIAGIPSRYIEGYLVKADDNGVTDVTGKDAHAWVELYFDGFGWLSFDPTPDESQRDMPDPPLPQDNTDEPDDDNPDGPDATEAPTEEPTIAPDETPDDEPTNVPPEATPMPSSPAAATEPPAPSDAPSPDDDDSEFDPEQELKWILWAALAILILAIIIIIYRLYATNPAHASQKFDANGDKLMVYYRATLTVQETQGMLPAGGESPLSYAGRLLQENQAAESFKQLSEHVTRAQYASSPVTEEMLTIAAQAYTDAAGSLSLKERLRWLRRRIRRGIGDVSHIP